jgi:hypothetical protein
MVNHDGKNYVTLEELLASVLLEESFVSNRTSKVINHKQEDWLDLSLIIAGIVTQGDILYFVRNS